MLFLSTGSDSEVEVVSVEIVTPPPTEFYFDVEEGSWSNPPGDGWCGPACCDWICQKVGIDKTKDDIAEEMDLRNKNQWMNSTALKQWVEAQVPAFVVKEYSSERTPTTLRSRAPRIVIRSFGDRALYRSHGATDQEANTNTPVFGVVNGGRKHWWVFEEGILLRVES